MPFIRAQQLLLGSLNLTLMSSFTEPSHMRVLQPSTRQPTCLASPEVRARGRQSTGFGQVV